MSTAAKRSLWDEPLPSRREAILLAHIARAPHGRVTVRQLARELGATAQRREQLEELLARLTARGALVEYRPAHFMTVSGNPNLVVGRLQTHRDGYGFLIAEKAPPGIAGDVFLSAQEAARAMHGDRVLVEIVRRREDQRADGRIVRVLERAHPTVVGTFRRGRFGNFVTPQDDRIRDAILIPPGLEQPAMPYSADRTGDLIRRDGADLDGMVVDVELLEFPTAGDPAVGRVLEVLGREDDFGVDVEIVIRKHHLPHRFPPEVLREAESHPATVRAEEIRGRRDFRHLDIVTIDGETARDFDDAVWVDRLPGGGYVLQVHIADVSHYVREGSAIDGEAKRRGTSVYFPDRAIPMLPLELSTELCSLQPQVDRLALSALLEISSTGEVRRYEFAESVIRSAERMTYTAVHLLLEGDAGMRERYARLAPRFELMQELALVLNRRRAARGSIDFDLPEPIIEFDTEGAMVGVSRAPRNVAHRIIEEFMLAANETVASHLERAGVPSIYRIHEPPNPMRVMEFEEIAAHFGYSLGATPPTVRRFRQVDRKSDGRKVQRQLDVPAEISVTARHYQRLVSRIAGRPEERMVSYLMLRSLKQARYSAENTGHFALAAPCYTHFTSPIRRYPDLQVHRILKRQLRGEESKSPAAPAEHERLELAALADGCSLTERRAAEAERELLEWKKLKFMTERVGDEFDALVINVHRAGLTVELTEYFVEGLVLLESMEGDRFFYHENARAVVGQISKREFRMGDSMRVRLDRVDGMERQLYFSVLAPPGVKSPRRRAKNASRGG